MSAPLSEEPATTVARRQRSLYRGTDDKMIAGVCSGLGHYFDLDTTLVRAGFVVFTLLGGAGLLAYVVLWFAMDAGPVPRSVVERSPQGGPDPKPPLSEAPETDTNGEDETADQDQVRD